MKPQPLATSADPVQIEALRPIVEGWRCVVIGSAPLLTRYVAVNADEVRLPVNGGISSVQGPIDCWIVNSKAQDAAGSMMRPLHKLMLEQARGRQVRHVLMLRGPKVPSEHHTRARLLDMRCQFETLSVLDKPTKRWIEGELCARASDKHPCSSGILAVACALWAGAASVRLAGFSFTPGYQYLPIEQAHSWWRDHIPADKRALVALRARFGDKLIHEFDAREIAA